MSGETWTATINVTVHGRWDPADEKACAALIGAVNRLRVTGNARPKIRRGWWSNDEQPWLDVEIGRTSMRLDAGEYLASVVMPDGSTQWLPLDDDGLAELRPAVPTSDQNGEQQ